MNRGTAKAHGLSFLFIRNLCYIHFPPCFIIVPQFAISVGITGPSGSSFSPAFVLPLSLHLSPNHSVNHPASVYRLSFLKLLSFLPSSSAPLFSTPTSLSPQRWISPEDSLGGLATALS